MTRLRTVRCRTVTGGRFRQTSYVQGMPATLVDEPTALPHPDPAPEPLELLLSALGACLAVGVRANAVARGIVLSRLELRLESDIAATPMDETGPEPVPIGFETVRVIVHLEADASPEVLAELVSRATLWSPVANTIHDSVQLDVRLASPSQ